MTPAQRATLDHLMRDHAAGADHADARGNPAMRQWHQDRADALRAALVVRHDPASCATCADGVSQCGEALKERFSVERTCGTCAHLRDHQPTLGAKVTHRCGNWDSLADESFDIDLDDGCIKGWTAREGRE